MSAFVAGVEVLTAHLPFRFSFGHALSQRRSSTNVYVKVTLSDATTGFGEGVPRVYVTGETVDDAVAGLCKRYAPALVGCRLDEPESVPAVLDHVARAVSSDGTGPPGAAWCALELAVLDAAGRRLGVPVRRWLGPLRASTLHYDAVVPFSGRRALDSVALAAKMLGLRRVKVKVGVDLEEDLYRLHRLRWWLGSDADLRVDANCAWTADQALVAIDRMRRYRIRCCSRFS